MNYQIDLLDIFTLLISVIALIATLRKKEFGKFYFIPKKENQKDIWIKLIKSDLYDLKFICEPYKDMKCRINLYDCNTQTDSTIDFPTETEPIFEIGLLKENTIVKFRTCNSSQIHIEFKDKYNNHYTQNLTQERISERRQNNIWNLTFVGT
ncbi:MAG: hypothetical protein V4497_01965 [Bacteroidota bacterium]